MQIVMARKLFSASRLEIIDLSYNKLRSTLGFPCLVTLKRINLSHNRLSGVLGLETLPNLTHLDVSVRYASGSGGWRPSCVHDAAIPFVPFVPFAAV